MGLLVWCATYCDGNILCLAACSTAQSTVYALDSFLFVWAVDLIRQQFLDRADDPVGSVSYPILFASALSSIDVLPLDCAVMGSIDAMKYLAYPMLHSSHS